MSINLYSQLPGRALDSIAQYTGEPQTLGNICRSHRRELEKTKSYEMAISKGLSPMVGYKSEQAKDLTDALERTKISFTVYSDDPVLKASVEKVLQLLYSKKYFGSGKEACSFVLDSFARIAGPATYGQVRVVVKPLADVEGQYNSREYILTLNKQSVPKLGWGISLEDLEKTMESSPSSDPLKKQLVKFMSTIVHEMTHALHHAAFSSFMYAYDRNLQEELGCTEKEYNQSLQKAESELPNSIAWAWLFPFSLANEMRPEFVEPAKLVRAGDLGGAFTEFLARVPQMYCLYGSSHSQEEIGAALSEIFPLGHKVFWGPFKKKCEESRIGSRSKYALGGLASSPEHLFSAIGSFEAMIAANHMPWVIYGGKEPKLSFQMENHLQKYDTEKTMKKGCHCFEFIEPGRLAFSTKFLESFESLSKKSDGLSRVKLNDLLLQLEKEIGASFRKDARRDRERNKIPKISQYNTGISPYHFKYAERLFQKIYANYRSPYFRGQDSLSEVLGVFARLTRASDEDSVPFGDSICVDLVRPLTDSSGGRKKVADWDLSRCLDNGCHFYSPRRSPLDVDTRSKLAISTDFLETFHRLDSEAEQSGKESKALKDLLKKVTDEIEKAVEQFREKADPDLVIQFGEIGSPYFRQLREKSDFKKNYTST